jgi:hypothetical protein
MHMVPIHIDVHNWDDYFHILPLGGPAFSTDGPQPILVSSPSSRLSATNRKVGRNLVAQSCWDRAEPMWGLSAPLGPSVPAIAAVSRL